VSEQHVPFFYRPPPSRGGKGGGDGDPKSPNVRRRRIGVKVERRRITVRGRIKEGGMVIQSRMM